MGSKHDIFYAERKTDYEAYFCAATAILQYQSILVSTVLNWPVTA